MSKTNTRPSHGPAGGPGHGGPGRNLGVKGEKPKNFWGTVRRLFGYMSKRMVAIIAVFVLAIAAVIFQIQTPKVLGKATSNRDVFDFCCIQLFTAIYYDTCFPTNSL